MKYPLLVISLWLACAMSAHAQAQAWPPKYAFSKHASISLAGNVSYDLNDFHGSGYPTGASLRDNDAWRRQEFGLLFKRDGQFDVGVTYDFAVQLWSDVFLRVETQAIFGKDLGKLRLGQVKIPLGFEFNTSSRAGSLLENSIATQAFHQSRRSGVDWALERPAFVANAGYYFESDLQGDNEGDTAAARLAWTPRKQAGDVLHLGLSLSQESPDSGRVRWRARPEAALTETRLLDSGPLIGVQHIRRTGLEALWIAGPVSLQGEYLRQDTTRDPGLRDYASDGWYLLGSWVLTGESRTYSSGNVGNPKPAKPSGAIELVGRYSHVDLDNDGIAGGHEHNTTLGANWYLTPYFKFQTNYVWVNAQRRGQTTNPGILELRAQLQF